MTLRKARELSGEGSQSKLKKGFKKLVDQGVIEPAREPDGAEQVFRLPRATDYTTTELFESDAAE